LTTSTTEAVYSFSLPEIWYKKNGIFLISNFGLVQIVVCFLLGDSLASVV
jgi:hypothetical protein